MDRERAWAILCEWTTSPNLRKHMLAVEASMRAYARRFGEDQDLWGVVGLLHDLDYERFPSAEAGHPFKGADALRTAGYPERVSRAILSHADYSGVTRDSPLEKALFACDELTGFIVAVALVKPNRSLAEVDVSAVKRKLKDKAFARGVSREDIYRGAEELGIPFDEHIGFVLRALQGVAAQLGLGEEAPSAARNGGGPPEVTPLGAAATRLEHEGRDFRAGAHNAVEWVASYLENSRGYPVFPNLSPGEFRKGLPAQPPARGESLDVILSDFERMIIPAITHWNHPRFFAYFATTGSGPGIVGELLSAGLNVNAMLWRTSPAATELEEVTLDWFRQMVGLPAGFWGIIMDTASVATLCAMAAAREVTPGLDVREKGLAGGAQPTVYASAEAHSSVDKAALTLGIGRRGIRRVPVDDDFRMDAQALSRAIRRDRDDGYAPSCVVATVGTTSTTSIDPVPQIVEVCRREDIWLHVDAAYAGTAAIVPELRHVLAGADAADSIVINPHKWLATPIDCSALFCRRPDALRRAFSLIPDYLATSDDSGTNFMDYGVQLGRKFRALKLWMVLRYFGWEALADVIRQHVSWAKAFGEWVDGHALFERMAPVPLSTVCFRLRPDGWADDKLDKLNTTLLERVNLTGHAFLSHTRINGRTALRLAIGNYRTTLKDVEATWELIKREAEALMERVISQPSL